jgi:hypothetical protein
VAKLVKIDSHEKGDSVSDQLCDYGYHSFLYLNYNIDRGKGSPEGGRCDIISDIVVMEVYLGDVVRLRKKHPCGSYEWEVVRLGADIGIRCRGCQRRVLLPRRVFEKRVKAFLSRGGGHPLEAGANRC